MQGYDNFGYYLSAVLNGVLLTLVCQSVASYIKERKEAKRDGRRGSEVRPDGEG